MACLLQLGLTVLIVLLPVPGAAATEQIRVLLAQDVLSVTLQSETGLILEGGAGGERPVSGAVTLTATGNEVVAPKVGVSGGAVRCRGRSGEVTVVMAADAGSVTKLGAGNQAQLRTMRVPGVLRVFGRAGRVWVVNELDLEEYVKGVVPAEMNASWHAEALKVQAVAARTYALYQRMTNAAREYDLVAGTQDQVYRGRDGVDLRIVAAVEETRGLIVAHENAPILAAFSSTAAGPTEDALLVWSKDLPYLKGVDCPFDQNSPHYQWRVAIPVTVLEEALLKQGMAVGTIASVTPYRYSRSGRVDKIRILHARGEVTLRGQDFRKAVGYAVIPSTQFEVEFMGRDLILSGRGSGHGVGLCQWGAKELAERGYRFDAILHYYFPGTVLSRYVRASAVPSAH